MTLTEIREKIAAMPSGAIFTDETRYAPQYLNAIINTYRGNLVRNIYLEEKRIDIHYYQKFYCEFNANLQKKGGPVYFACPPAIALDGRGDGFKYIGTEDCSIAYNRILSRGQLSNFNNHPIMSVRKGLYGVSAFYDANEQLWEIYGNPDLRELMVEGVFANPLDIPRFNPDTDDYPIPEGDIPLLEELIFNANTSKSSQTQPDYIPNKIDG